MERLGHGGMAEVFMARLERRDQFRKLVALKRMLPHPADESFAGRFLEEARTIAHFHHPNLVEVFDYGEHHGRPYLVMELIDGLDLWRMLHVPPREPMPIPAALYVAAEISRALGYVHAFKLDGKPLDVVHRDVSPQNILVGRNGEVKLVDFGIAKSFRGVACRPQTEHNTILGKMRYMAPEQLARDTLDGRADLYALGVVLHEMLSGKRLIDAKSLPSLVLQIRDAKFAVPSATNPAVSPELDALVMRFLARDPRDRYADGHAASLALHTYLGTFAPGFGAAQLGELVNGRMQRLTAGVPAPATPEDGAEEVSWQSAPTSRNGSTSAPSAASAEGLRPTLSLWGHHPAPALLSPTQVDVEDEDAPSIVIVRDEELPVPAPELHLETALEPVQLMAADSSPRRTCGIFPVIQSRSRRFPMAIGACAMTFGLLLGAFGDDGVTATPAVAMPRTAAVPSVVAAVSFAPAKAEPAVSTPTAPEEVHATPPPPPVRVHQARATTARYLDGKPALLAGDLPPSGLEDEVRRARDIYRVARRALAGGHAVAAAAGFEKALDEYPGLVAAYRGLGAAYLAASQRDLAADALRTVLPFETPVERPRLRQVLAQLTRGDDVSLFVPELP